MTETVTPQREFGSKSGMGIIGWTIAILIGFLLLPVSPFLLLVYLVLRAFGAGKRPK